MARVPVSPGNTVALRPVSDARFRPADNNGGVIGAIGQGMQTLGGAGIQAANEFDQVQEAYDTAGAKKLDNQRMERYRAALWTGDDAYFTKEGFDAQNARPIVEKSLADIDAELANQATTPRMKDMFLQSAARQRGQELTGVARYADGQIKQEETKQSVARMGNFQDDAIRYADDPARFAENLNGGLIELRSQADKGGWAPETLKAAEAKYTSEIHKSVVQAKLAADDVDGALAYRSAHADEMDWKAKADLDDAMKPALERREQSGDADSVIGLATRDGATPVQYGDPLRGAGTGVSDAFGVARGNGKTHNGVDFTGKEGTPIYAIAPGRVVKVSHDAKSGNFVIVDHGNGRTSSYSHMNGAKVEVGDEITPDTQLGGIGMTGHTTGSHVHVVVREGGKTVDPQQVIGHARQEPREHDLNSLLARVDTKADREGWTFERRDRAKAEVERRVNRDEGLLDRQYKAAEAEAYDVVDRLGDRFTDISQIPAGIRSQMKSDDRIRLRNQAAQNAKPKSVPANGDTALGLNLLAIQNADAFLGTDLRKYRTDVTPAEFAQLAELQAKTRTNPKAPVAVQHESIWGMINRYGPDIDLKTGKDAKPADRQKAQRLFSIMKADLDRTVGNEKRAPTDDEVKAAFDRGITAVTLPDAGWFGADKTARRFEVEPGSTRQVVIPTAVVQRIEASFARRNGGKPTERQLMDTYLDNKGRPGFWE